MKKSVDHFKYNGMLAVNKASGMISKDVSRWLVNHLGRVKLGHVGTLDPNAEGVLPVLFGRATRLQDYLLDHPKTYEFEVTFGSETDTLDSEGEVVATAPWEHLGEGMLRAAMPAFVGEIEQEPPLYSAVKYKGKALYEYARQGDGDEIPVAGLKRQVKIDKFELLQYQHGIGRFRLICHRGTYVRTLVRDLARLVQSCGTLTQLVRTRAAGIEIATALRLEEVEARIGEFETLLVPIESIDLGMPKWMAVNEEWSNRLLSGGQLTLEHAMFFRGLLEKTQSNMPGGWARPFVLLDSEGKAFGLGAAKSQGVGRITVSMKRGLL